MKSLAPIIAARWVCERLWRLIRLVSLYILLWIHKDSYESACEDFAAAVQDHCPGTCAHCCDEEMTARLDLEARKKRISQIHARIRAIS